MKLNIKNNFKLMSVAVITTLLASCASNPQQPNIVDQFQKIPANPTRIKQPVLVDILPKDDYASFYEWKQDFTRRAISEGYHNSDVERLMASASLNQKIISSDRNQSEFAKMPWEYVDSAASSTRVNGGIKNFTNNSGLFSNIESLYGVDGEIIAAIWGMESSYGGFMGSSGLVSSLSSLAYEGRRRGFAENQLKALLVLLDRGDVSWDQLEGSWAGGMGHTQFIPATWLKQGVDGNGDGQKNPWNSTDALNATANYLSNSGWVRGLSPYYEATLPSNFDFSQLDSKKTMSDWHSAGVNLMNGDVPEDAELKLWLPAGKDGPALLTSVNFDVIKVYNNSSSYALGVSTLAKKIAGDTGIIKSWPRYAKPLTTEEVQVLQNNLTAKGYDTKGADGIIGTNTRKSFARWQADNNQAADGFIYKDSASSLIW